MEHNLNIYQIGVRYILCLFSGLIGGLLYDAIPMAGYIGAVLCFIFFLEGILAYSPLMQILGKNNSKTAVDDFK
jgi:hypothetical protein